MRLLWTFVKVVLGLALFIPLCIIALAAALGILGTLVGLAIVVVRFALVGLVAYGVFRLIATLVRRPQSQTRPAEIAPPPPAPRRDPYYESALRELDRELGDAR